MPDGTWKALALMGSALGALNFFWSLYKDFRYRANVKVTISIQQRGAAMVPILEVINHGPGTVTLDYYIHDCLPWWRDLFSKRSRMKFTFPYPLNIKLAPGDVHRQEEPLEFFIAGRGVTRIGVSDKMRNFYFAPRSQVRWVNHYVRNNEPGKSLRTMKPPIKSSVNPPKSKPAY
jgi:hypothetical protein